MLIKSLALVLLSGSGLALLIGGADPALDPDRSVLGNAVPTASSERAFPGFDERVEPGLVSWHADLDAARAAAAESGRPILHFQLLGELDEALC